MYKRILIAGILLSAISTGSANLQSKVESAVTLEPKISTCSFGAFVTETDPNGLNVRASPTIAGKILGTLPPVIENHELGDYPVKIELQVVGVNNGWFKITQARDNPLLTGKSARKVFSGTGWVSGRKLTVKSQANKGFAEPNVNSPVVVSLREEIGFDTDQLVQAGQLISCMGGWALVEFSTAGLSSDIIRLIEILPNNSQSLSGNRFRAWVNKICAIQETSCSE